MARAMGASLIAPMALLLAATLVAAGGGGLGGLGSLGQIASGPSVPDSGLASVPRSSLGEAELVTASVGADSPSAPTGEGPAPSGPGAPSAGPNGSPGGGDLGLTPGEPGGPGTPNIRGTDPPVTGGPPASTPGAPQVADPVGEVIDPARGIGELVPAPLQPTTDGIIDSLLGPPR